MQLDSETIFNAAVQLPESERLTLVSRLMQTMPPTGIGLSLDDPGLLEELDRRFADEDGEVPWSDLRAEG